MRLPSRDLEEVLARTSGLWEGFRGARLFLTGGTGFFGRWMLESLLHAEMRLGLGLSAVILTRDPEGFARRAPELAGDPRVSFHPGDVRDFDFPEGAFTHVLHLAATSAEATFRGIRPLESFDTVVQGTRRTLDFALHCGARQVLFTSSGSACGPQPGNVPRLPEDWRGGPDPEDPCAALGEAKRVAEWLCREYARHHRLEVKIARCFSFLGPLLQTDLHYAAGNFLRDALAGGPIRVRGDGSPVRSFLYAGDLAAWLWTILAEGQPGRIYHVGSERPVSILELAWAVARAAGPVAVEVQGEQVAGPASSRYVPATARTREELGLGEWTDLETALARTAAFLRAPGGD